MRVFKFGGASVKDAKGLKNLAGIVAKSEGNLVVVVSAMGKMTNAFEDLTRAYFKSDEQKWEQFTLIRNYHSQIMDELFDSSDDVFTQVDEVFFKIEDRLERKPSLDYDFEYDQLVCYGEILSTKIVSAYLNKIGVENTWADVRFVLRTNDKWRDASVNWPQTEKLMKEKFNFANNK
ncbi:MAG: aspartate kinase, partial [Prolixibacteraceae bacterium]|nr:aspartate kinase [Prolixibacteraceae bacterium]